MKFSYSFVTLVLATAAAVHASVREPPTSAYGTPGNASPHLEDQVTPPVERTPPTPLQPPPQQPPQQVMCCPCQCSYQQPPPPPTRSDLPPPPPPSTPGLTDGGSPPSGSPHLDDTGVPPPNDNGFTTTSIDEDGNVHTSSAANVAPFMTSFALTMVAGALLL